MGLRNSDARIYFNCNSKTTIDIALYNYMPKHTNSVVLQLTHKMRECDPL